MFLTLSKPSPKKPKTCKSHVQSAHKQTSALKKKSRGAKKLPIFFSSSAINVCQKRCGDVVPNIAKIAETKPSRTARTYTREGRGCNAYIIN